VVVPVTGLTCAVIRPKSSYAYVEVSVRIGDRGEESIQRIATGAANFLRSLGAKISPSLTYAHHVR